ASAPRQVVLARARIGYRRMRRNRKAFAITDTQLRLIAALASIGESSRPNSGYSTPAAIGTPRALYPNAHARFSRMFRMVARDRRRAGAVAPTHAPHPRH